MSKLALLSVILLASLSLSTHQPQRQQNKKVDTSLLLVHNCYCDYAFPIGDNFWKIPEDLDTITIQGSHLNKEIDRYVKAAVPMHGLCDETIYFSVLIRNRGEKRDTLIFAITPELFYLNQTCYRDTSGFLHHLFYNFTDIDRSTFK